MKKDIAGTEILLSRWWCRLGFIVAMILTGLHPAMTQDTAVDTTAQQTDTTTAPVEEETTIKTKMSLSADQYPDGSIKVIGLLRAKIEGSYQKVPDRKVEFFTLNAEGEETAIGDTVTDLTGTAKIRVSKTMLSKSEDGSFSLLARFAGDEKLEDSESDLILKPAMLVMEPRAEDSTFLLSLTATADAPEGPQPIVAAVVSVYVKRMFSSLKVGEGETDEAGMLEIEFPAGLAGDDSGNLEITAIIEETEEYGNLSAVTVQKWGNPVSSALVDSPRALWSPLPPTWMVITFFILMGAVWIHYAIVIYNLIKIKSDGRHTAGKA